MRGRDGGSGVMVKQLKALARAADDSHNRARAAAARADPIGEPAV
jgi:hypothetical protein